MKWPFERRSYWKLCPPDYALPIVWTFSSKSLATTSEKNEARRAPSVFCFAYSLIVSGLPKLSSISSAGLDLSHQFFSHTFSGSTHAQSLLFICLN